MEELPDRFEANSQLTTLLNNLRIDILIPFHQRFLRALQTNAENTKAGLGPNIADVFVEFKVSFFLKFKYIY